jgi:hypothetical protein
MLHCIASIPFPAPISENKINAIYFPKKLRVIKTVTFLELKNATNDIHT